MISSAWFEKDPVFLGSEWTSMLEARKQEEASFHDGDAIEHRNEVEREAGGSIVP